MAEQQEVDHDGRLIDIKDLDASLYRIFRLEDFYDILRYRRLTLRSPSKWEDPYEALASNVMMMHPMGDTRPQQSLQKYLVPAYAQCWSTTQESDTIWRAYSRVIKAPTGLNDAQSAEGVQVRTTVRKLAALMKVWEAESSSATFFLGAVRYAAQKDVVQYVADTLATYGPRECGRGRIRVQMLLVKRDHFAHEAEVRLVCLDGQSGSDEAGSVHVAANPNALFDEVTFDPRLIGYEKGQREAAARELDYSGPFGRSEMYQGSFFLIVLPNGWDDAVTAAAANERPGSA